LVIDVLGAMLLAAIFTSLLFVVARRLPAPAQERTEPWDSLARVVTAIHPHAAAVALIGATSLIALTGALASHLDLESGVLRVNAEQSIASYYSSGLLFAAAALALLTGQEHETESLPWTLVALTLAVVGFSEAAELHERVEVRTDLPAPIVLAPLGAVGAYSWMRTIPTMRERPPSLALFSAGVAGWVVSLASDPFHASWKSVVEESLEMGGSTLVVLGLLVASRAGLSREAAAS
jgi:hypothetical protein